MDADKHKIFFSDSPDGKFLESLHEFGSETVLYAMAFMLGINQPPSQPGFEPRSPASIEGPFLAIAHRHGFSGITKGYNEALQSLFDDWNKTLADGKIILDSTKKRYRDLEEKYSLQISTQEKEFAQFRESSGNEIKDLIQKSEGELKKIERAYDEKLALQASVKYWKVKAQNHADSAKLLSYSTIGVGILFATMLVIEIYLIIGGSQKIGNLPIWQGSMMLLTVILGFWALRILVRLLLSNLHLKSEPVERRTMLLTYLALLRRGQGPTDQQRELILQLLFRPSVTGIIKDDGLPQWAAQWLKVTTEVKP